MEAKRKLRIGRVISNKMNKTVVVAIEVPKRHPLYKKVVKGVVKYKVHDEKNESKPGDVIKIKESRPLSKEKRWRLAEIITKSEVLEVRPEEIAVELKPEVKPEVEQTSPQQSTAA